MRGQRAMPAARCAAPEARDGRALCGARSEAHPGVFVWRASWCDAQSTAHPQTLAVHPSPAAAIPSCCCADGGKASARAGLRGGGVTAQEARQILNVNPKATPAEIEESCAFLLSANDPAKGGSSYVQSKIRNARAALIVEEPPATAGAAGGGSAAAGQKAPDSK